MQTLKLIALAVALVAAIAGGGACAVKGDEPPAIREILQTNPNWEMLLYVWDSNCPACDLLKSYKFDDHYRKKNWTVKTIVANDGIAPRFEIRICEGGTCFRKTTDWDLLGLHLVHGRESRLQVFDKWVTRVRSEYLFGGRPRQPN